MKTPRSDEGNKEALCSVAKVSASHPRTNPGRWGRDVESWHIHSPCPRPIRAADYSQVPSGVRDRRQLLMNPPHQAAGLWSSLLPIPKFSFHTVRCHSNLEHLTPSLQAQLTPGVTVRSLLGPLCVGVKWLCELKWWIQGPEAEHRPIQMPSDIFTEPGLAGNKVKETVTLIAASKTNTPIGWTRAKLLPLKIPQRCCQKGCWNKLPEVTVT